MILVTGRRSKSLDAFKEVVEWRACSRGGRQHPTLEVLRSIPARIGNGRSCYAHGRHGDVRGLQRGRRMFGSVSRASRVDPAEVLRDS